MNIKKNGRHIPSSPIAVMINQSEIGDASRVRVSGQGLSEARTFEPAEFIIDTRDAGKKNYKNIPAHRGLSSRFSSKHSDAFSIQAMVA